ncbi:MAG: Shikimate 5-dehydrogenase, partial [uncultured bacterium]
MSILKLFVTLSGNKREGFAISSVTSRKFGIIGYPLKHTLSPLMHNNNFKRLGVNATYVPYEILPDDFQKQALTLKSMFDGFNVTVPFKEEIIPF